MVAAAAAKPVSELDATPVFYLTGAFTMEPGDVIATGTVAGVGVLMNPQTFLKEDGAVGAEVEKLGHLEHTVVRERD